MNKTLRINSRAPLTDRRGGMRARLIAQAASLRALLAGDMTPRRHLAEAQAEIDALLLIELARRRAWLR